MVLSPAWPQPLYEADQDYLSVDDVLVHWNSLSASISTRLLYKLHIQVIDEYFDNWNKKRNRFTIDNEHFDVSIRFQMNKHEKLLQQLCQVRITFYFSLLTPNPRNSSLTVSGIASDGGKN